MNQLYISICPETGRKFLCEAGKDGNLAEFFTDAKLRANSPLDLTASVNCAKP